MLGELMQYSILALFQDKNIILTRRAAHLRSFPNIVCLPGGKTEALETPRETAIREAHEELGFTDKIKIVNSLHMLTVPLEENKPPFTICPYIGVVSKSVEFTPNEEVAELTSSPA
jgi:8-oxo-dGTP pyrophosphatase MutT (NUDIX family)